MDASVAGIVDFEEICRSPKPGTAIPEAVPSKPRLERTLRDF
jgi:hypothetical protein